MESPDVRSRAKKVDTKKLSALEKLKKARQGEKVEDEPEPEEEDIWEYEEIDEDEEEEFESKSSKSKSSKNNRHESRESESKKPVKRNYTKDKSSSGSTASSAAATSESNDIRTAFMRSSMVSSSKPSKSNAEASVKIDEDELANEIMQELNKKKAQRAATSQKPAVMASQSNRAPSKLLSMNSPSTSNAMCLSPAHKRKPSPSSGPGAGGASIPPKSKKLDLDVEMIPIEIKKENIDPDEQEALENIELLSLLDSSLKQEPINHEATTIAANTTTPFIDDFQMQVKSEPEAMMDRTTIDESKVLDADLQLQLENQAQSNKFLFYWYDLFEDQFNPNSTVYMFGKMPVKIKRDESDAASTTTTTPDQQLTFVSVCCVVKNLPKRVYILPRRNKRPLVKAEPGQEKKPEPVTMDMVAQEVAEIMAKMKINNYRTKVVRKHFAFDKKLADNYDYETVPVESDYLQLEYHSDSSAKVISPDLVGETFACVFGAQTSYTEHLVIDLKLKGPNWLEITNGKRRENQLSWCKCEYEVSNYRDISVYKDNVTLDSPAIPLPPTPPLTLLTLLLRTVLNPKTQEHEIVCAAGLVMNKFYLEKATTPSTIQKQPLLYDSYFCALSKPSQAIFPYDLSNTLKNYQSKLRVNECGPERALISFLLSKIQSLDVDVLVGHDLFGFSLDILLNRCNVHKIPHWSRLGRLKRSQMPHLPHHRAGGAPRSTAVNNLAIQQRIQTVFSGRLLCDVMLSAKELLTKCKSFDLPELVNHLLVKKDPVVANAIASRDYEEERNVANYYASSQQLLKLLRLTMDDCMYISRIVNDLQCLQLAYQITCIAGNVLSRTLVGGRSERNEYLLLHAFFDKDFILPEKLTAFKAKQAAAAAAASKSKKVVTIKSEETTMNETASNQTAALEENEDEMLSRMIIDEESSQPRVKREDGAPVNTHSASSNGYTGGLVLEPKIGFYDKFILLLDFNSLYPSIIQEYNICFTTVFRPKNQLAENDIDEYIETCIRAPPSDEKPGILPLEIRKLVDSRRQVKQLASQTTNPELKMQYDIRQKALKLTANSVYGCLGFENSRFYCKPLAALITRNGRNILMKTKELVESKKIEVIYGDTDSIMINTNLTDFDQVYKLGNMIKSEVNKLYKNLEIDIDGVYKCLLLLRKKKYAALTISRNPKDNSLVTQKELKGLDIVRRDWCPLARQIGERVLDEILSGQSYDVVLTNINKILNDTGDKVRNNMFDLALFEISKQLNRNPEDYNDANHQPHVLVALRNNSDNANSKKYKSGDVVSYIICEDGTQNSATQRAYSKSELLKASAEAAKNTTNTSALKLDTKYYLAQQVHPVVTRLCESFEGIDGYHIAQCLGLDPTGFRHKSTAGSSHSTVSIAPTQLTKQQQRIESYLNELEKFNNCVAFKYVCPNCKTEQSWQSLFVKVAPTTASSGSVKPEPKQEEEDEDDDILNLDGTNIVKTAPKAAQSTSSNNFRCILDSCANPVCKLKPINKLAYVKNSLALQMHKFIKQYYQGWLVCEEPMCRYRTKRISCKLVDGKHRCIECEKSPVYLEYSHSDLYYQLKFFKFIFDIDSYKNFYKDDAAEVSHILKNNQQLQQALNQLKDQAAKKIRMDAFGIVDMKSLFKFAAGNGICFKSE